MTIRPVFFWPLSFDYVPYASPSLRESRAAFNAWIESDHFRKAYAQASAPKGSYPGHPKLETLESVLSA